MQDLALMIFAIVSALIINPINIMLIISPIAFSVTYECIVKKCTTFDIVIATLSVFLLFAGLIIGLLGVGLTSPLFIQNNNSYEIISTHVLFNNQNIPLINSTNECQSFAGINTTNGSILNISTTLQPSASDWGIGIMGLCLAIVSLGLSLILSAISILYPIIKSCENMKFDYYNYRNLSIIYGILGLFILIYGYCLPNSSSNEMINLANVLVILFGYIYADAGLAFFILFSVIINNEKTFNQKILVVITQIKRLNSISGYHQTFSLMLEDRIYIFVNNMKNVMSNSIKTGIVFILSLSLIIFAGIAFLKPESIWNNLPQIITFEIALGPFSWASLTYYYSWRQSRCSSPAATPATRSEDDK